jgi:hypothetical protein
MPTLCTGQSSRRPHLRAVGIAGVAALLITAPGTAHAAAPLAGVWESESRSQPRVAFDVRGPARSRAVMRVSFPLTCKGEPSAVGWGTTTLVRVADGGRFTAYDFGSVLRGRFTAPNRAEVTVHADNGGNCRDTRRYVVVHRGPRVAVPSGRYLSLVGGGAEMELETSAFGRMVRVEYIDGSMATDCSDGSQRSLRLAAPDGFALAAPIRLNGRFDISAAAGSSIAIAGSFREGSVAALVDFSVVLPSGVRCKARTQPLVGSLAFPLPTGSGEGAMSAEPPVVPLHPGDAGLPCAEQVSPSCT